MYRDILVYLDPWPDAEIRLKVATTLARLHNARLIGMEACAPAAFEGGWFDRVTSLPDTFNEAIKLSGVEGQYVAIDRWASAGRHDYAHYVDLIIASQPEFEARKLIVPGVPEDVLLSGGVPMLLLPYGWRPRSIGERILIAWKSSREAARAVHDAMPFLSRAQKVTAFTFEPRPDGSGEEPDSLIDHLRRHDVVAEPSRWRSDGGDLTPVDALFASLEAQDADLIVAGAYGHARWIEGLFGGVSRDLVRQPSLPVLLSH
ncbi:MAG TPA: universal stress protein [Roseiarcus sp.]|nr:universal stress protein [Roseiarcus sp.]